jgi:hypothetical protein
MRLQGLGAGGRARQEERDGGAERKDARRAAAKNAQPRATLRWILRIGRTSLDVFHVRLN